MKRVSVFLLFSLMMVVTNFADARTSCADAWKSKNHKYDFKEAYGDYYRRLKRDECEKDWTILVYMAADNNLFPYALWDLYDMEARFKSDNNPAGSTLRSDLVVQVDGTAPDDLRRIHIYSGPVEYGKKQKKDFEDVTLESVKSPVVEKLPENDGSSEEKRLADFLLWGIKKYPSKNVFVILWSHGQGWKAFPIAKKAESRFLKEKDVALNIPHSEPDGRFGGIAFNQSSGKWLDIPALRSVLDRVKRASGKQIDVYGSDACLMQMMEVAYELSGSSKYILGTTQIQAYLGLPYRRILYEINTGHFNGINGGPDEQAYRVAKMIPEMMKASLDPLRGSHREAGKDAFNFVTSSALTSSEMQRMLIPKIKLLGAALENYLNEDKLRAIDITFVLQSVPAIEGNAQDLGVFLGLLEQLLHEEVAKNGIASPASVQLHDTINSVKDSLDQSILSYVYGKAFAVDGNAKLMGFIPRAVSVWLPVDPEEYKSRRDEFMASRFYRDTKWNRWLDLIYAP